MFKDKLKNDLDKLSPDANVKAAVMQSLSKQKKPRYSKFIIYAAACLAVLTVISVLNYDHLGKAIINNSKPSKSSSGNVNNGESDSAYDKIYNAIDENYNNVIYEKGHIQYSYKHMEALDSSPSAGRDFYSKTNTQLENVDEDDIIKTNGNFIYRLSDEKIYIYKANGKKTERIDVVKLNIKDDNYSESIYLYKNKLILIVNIYEEEYKSSKKDSLEYFKDFTEIRIYDILPNGKIRSNKTFRQSGYYDNSRMIGDILYLNSSFYIYSNYDSKIKKEDYDKYIPTLYNENKKCIQKSNHIYLSDDLTENHYSMLCSYDVLAGTRVDDKSVFGGAHIEYVSENNIYLSEEEYNEDEIKTKIIKLEMKEGLINKKAETKINGEILNQFSLDEKDGYLRLVATYEGKKQYNVLYILDENLKISGKIEGLAKNERIYSARFIGDYAYFVTFKETDPLFCADISNPSNPKIISKLKLPGFSNYLHPYDKDRLFGFGNSATDSGEVTGLKISMFNISDKEKIKEECSLKLKGDYSDANYDHKAIIVSPDKNLIGFSVDQEYFSDDDDEDYFVDNKYYYYIYSYDAKKGFKKELELYLGDDCSDNVRGLYIGDYFYVSDGNKLTIISLNNFKTVKRV